MNFISALDELNKLYESVDTDKLEEEAEIEEAEIEEVEEEAEEVEEEVAAGKVVLECTKCGALVIKSGEELVIDEDSDLANVEEECAYCGEAAGFKAVGTFEPYESDIAEEEAPEEAEDAEVIEIEEDEVEEEVVEESIEEDPVEEEPIKEGIFNRSVVDKNIMAYKPNDPNYSKEVADDIKSVCGGEVIAVKIKGKENSPIDYVWVANNNSEYRKAMKYTNKKYPDTSFTYDYDYSNCMVTEGILDNIKDKIFN